MIRYNAALDFEQSYLIKYNHFPLQNQIKQ